MTFEVKTDKELVRDEQEKKDKLMILFALVVLLMSIAYGTITKKIISTDPVNNNDAIWSISYSSIKTVEKTVGAFDIIAPSFENTSAFINAGFNKLGDSITYELAVTNNGTLDAKLKSISIYNSNYDAFEYTTKGIEEGDILRSGETRRFELTIKVKTVKTDVKEHFLVNLNYIQN